MAFPPHLDQVYTLCVQALGCAIGLRLRVNNPDLFRARFYQVQKQAVEPKALICLNTSDGAILLVRRDKRNLADGVVT